MSFWLRHKANGAGTWTQQEFEGLSFYERKETTRVNGETLRGNLYSHRKSKRRVWSLVISSDETAAHAAFLQAFWEADLLQVSTLATPAAGTDGDGTFVVTEGGQEPLEFIDGFPDLKEYTFNLREAAGS